MSRLEKRRRSNPQRLGAEAEEAEEKQSFESLLQGVQLRIIPSYQCFSCG